MRLLTQKEKTFRDGRDCRVSNVQFRSNIKIELKTKAASSPCSTNIYMYSEKKKGDSTDIKNTEES